ncbi:MAG: hypothetical protein AAFY17_09365 [Cyanobacteria bacterium J06642_11]
MTTTTAPLAEDATRKAAAALATLYACGLTRALPKAETERLIEQLGGQMEEDEAIATLRSIAQQ